MWNHSLYKYKDSAHGGFAEAEAPQSLADSALGGNSWRVTRAQWDAFSFFGKVDVDVRLQIAPYVGGIEQQRSISRAQRRRVWSLEFVDDLVSQCRRGDLAGEFGIAHVQRVVEALKEQDVRVHVVGKQVLVFSSGEPPWLEACVLSLGAAGVTRIGPGRVTSQHPKLVVYTPAEAEALEAAQRLPRFDAAASYAVLQHEGFGRHGELLSPLADLQILARAWCVLKPAAPMLLAVPLGPDYIHWKAHRRYGRVMLPHLLANWKVRLPDRKTFQWATATPLLLLERLKPVALSQA